MNRIEHYHDWLRDAHAMEKQAESMLESMASRIDNYPELRARIEQHLSETKNQIVQLETILDRNDISRSVIKDSMSKMAALGQSIGGIFPSDEIVKGSISGYVFEQFEIARYSTDLDERVEAVKELLAFYKDETPFIYLYKPYESFALDADIQYEIPANVRAYTIGLRAGEISMGQ